MRQPAAPKGFLPEVAFSDDRRGFTLMAWGLAWLRGIYPVTCAAAWSSVQVGKPKVYDAVSRNRRLHYAPGTLLPTLGPLPLQSGGFMLTEVPILGAAAPYHGRNPLGGARSFGGNGTANGRRHLGVPAIATA